MKKTLTVALAAAALAVVPMTAAMADSHEATLQIVPTSVPSSVEGNPQITIVHGVPGADGVSVLAGDDALLSDVNFTDVVTTTDVPAGTYAIAISGSDSTDDIVIGPVDLTFEENTAYAVVAHLDADGELTASQFTLNDGEGVSAFHTAAFVPVAIVAGGEIQADDLTNGNAAQLDLEPGTELPDVGVAAAGSTDIALPVGDLTIVEGERILAFAVGAPAAADDEDDAEETEAPTAVHSGTAGLVNSGLPMWVAGLMALGALGLAVPAAATARRRS